MIDYELFARIKECRQQHGLTVPQIAQELSLDPRTVAKWLAQANFRPRQAKPKASKLDPFKPTLQRLLEKHPYTGMQLFQRLREEGYDGGYSILKQYLRLVRPKRPPAFLTLTFAPGECAQVDWGEFGTVAVGSTRRRLSFFVMVLCYSRMMYLEFTTSQTMEHFLACHRNAFEFFGGVPARIMVDNLKSAVIRRVVGQGPVFNTRYLDFAHHYGFVISPCNIGKGNEKGRVENGVGYIKKNFLNGLELDAFAPINPAARLWLNTIANQRLHGETRKKPVELFGEEQPTLKLLASPAYDVATILPVVASSRFRVTFETNRYSVPAAYASARLTLKVYPDRLCLYHQELLIARHVRSFDRHQDFEDPDHPKELLAQRQNARQQKLLQRFFALSPRAHAYYQELLHRSLNPQHHITRIVALAEIHGQQPVAQAMEDAFQFHAFRAEYLASILEQRARPIPERGALHLTRGQDHLAVELPPPNLAIYDRV